MVELIKSEKVAKVLKAWEKGQITEEEAFSFFDFASLKFDVRYDLIHRQNLILFHKKQGKKYETSR